MEWVNIIQTLGFPIACVIACAFFINKVVTRDKDDAKEREDKLIDANIKSSNALDKVADTIEESNKVNRELSETNRLLVEKVEGSLTKLNDSVKKILDKLDR